MNRNVIKAVTITSWLFTVLNIILQFTGVIPRDWIDTSLWTVLSIVWTTIWVDNLEKDNNKDNG
jgi:membrane protease YdiL (CAAX protease family)